MAAHPEPGAQAANQGSRSMTTLRLASSALCAHGIVVITTAVTPAVANIDDYPARATSVVDRLITHCYEMYQRQSVWPLANA